jgi:hypothetical protein
MPTGPLIIVSAGEDAATRGNIKEEKMTNNLRIFGMTDVALMANTNDF